jgi:hypothetical protein
MEAQKTENLIEHSAEIHARPPRTWFQTEREKRESKEGALAAYTAPVAAESKVDKSHKSEKNRKRKEREAEDDAGDIFNKKKKKDTSEMGENRKAIAGKVRSMKNMERALRLEGKSAGVAAKKVREMFSSKTKQNKPNNKNKAKGDGGLFGGDGIGSSLNSGRGVGKVSVGSGFKLGGAAAPQPSSVTKHKGKVGNFKSKGKFKRKK